jgi:hypothetical protein
MQESKCHCLNSIRAYSAQDTEVEMKMITDREAVSNLNQEVERLRAENARLKGNLKCVGIHTCHDKCNNPMCLMKKERDALQEEVMKTNARLEQWEKEDTHEAMKCYIKHEQLDSALAKLKIAEEALAFLVDSSPKDGGVGACLFCDMGGSGSSTKSDGHHDDTRDVCPILRQTEALAQIREQPLTSTTSKMT